MQNININELIKNISFKTDDEDLIKIFEEIAQEVTKKLKDDYILKYNYHAKKEYKNKKEMTSTQFRKFYDEIIKLNINSKGMNNREFQKHILPFIKMIKSKVANSHSKGNSGNNFKVLMDISIAKVNSQEELQNFKYFLESIIGYMPKK